ncbi:MAG: aspartate/glutamate racemase family protein [Acidobacteria bacterium]|nr:aspartate/glutamate racemase family protein [Acidobacteriota bacterium]MCB9378221.1 aspartate/glutamate racemase family protein [Holophagales bacterium]
MIATPALRLLVTDSGLGGLAVVAELERRARGSGRYREVDLRFASSLGETGQGYNKMASTERKVQVFDAALAGMLRGAEADALLVACNTLSVLIPRSRTLASAPLPVFGIVELGADAIAERLDAEPEAVAALFATETTLASGAHRSALLARGIAPERILEQPCPGLASRIELEGGSEGVISEIERFVAAAAERIGARAAPVVLALCCTHYGYCAAGFAAAASRHGLVRCEVLDPNRRMADRFFPPDEEGAGAPSRIAIRVVSRALPLAAEIESTARLLEPLSPATAAALRAYELRRDLFEFSGL